MLDWRYSCGFDGRMRNLVLLLAMFTIGCAQSTSSSGNKNQPGPKSVPNPDGTWSVQSKKCGEKALPVHAKDAIHVGDSNFASVRITEMTEDHACADILELARVIHQFSTSNEVYTETFDSHLATRRTLCQKLNGDRKNETYKNESKKLPDLEMTAQMIVGGNSMSMRVTGSPECEKELLTLELKRK